MPNAPDIMSINQRDLTLTARTPSVATLFGEKCKDQRQCCFVLAEYWVCCPVLCQEMNKLKDLSNAGALLFTVFRDLFPIGHIKVVSIGHLNRWLQPRQFQL